MPRTLVAGGALFAGTGREYLENSTVLIEDGRIAAVGLRPDFGEWPETSLIRADGLFVLPGLINAHAHLTFMYLAGPVGQVLARSAVEMTMHAVRTSAVLLSQGITTAREMGGTHGIPQAAKEAIAAGRLPGPRLTICGQPICVTGGHAWQVCIEADGPDAVRAAARGQLKAGADFVKVMASHDPWPMAGEEQTRAEMSVEELRAAIEEAHAWGKPAACHAMGSVALARVIEAGVDVIEHGQYLTTALAQQMAARSIYLTPTLSSYDVQTMHPRFGRGEAWATAHRTLVEAHHRAIAIALDAGVAILNGTDSVGCYAEEVALLRQYGLSAADSLLSCTRTAARALRVEAEVGTIEPGKRADLVLLREDPLLDPYALEEVELVIKDGRVHRPSDLTYAERVAGPDQDMVRLARRPRG